MGYSRVHVYAKNYQSMAQFCKVILPIRMALNLLLSSID